MLEFINENQGNPVENFCAKVSDKNTKELHTLQLNIGKRCNLSCSHCHVMAGQNRNEMMSLETFEKALKVFETFQFKTIDITGGEPTLHPHIETMLTRACQLTDHVILRSNLVGLAKRADFVTLLARLKVHLVASMPCYTKENVDAMRGEGTFDEVVASMKVLNEVGFGKELPLDLVYNPLGAFLPGPQGELEVDYKRELGKLGLSFSKLITITNLPMGCFKNKLAETGELEEYQTLLEENFNEATLDSLMCRYQLSVAYDGTIYDCDFNQMEGLKVEAYPTLDDVLAKEDLGREIIFRNYCYGCTAGAGSSCGGQLDE